MRHRWPTVLLASGATVPGMAMVFLVTSYGLAQGAGHLHLPLQIVIYLAMLSYGTVTSGRRRSARPRTGGAGGRDDALDRLDAH